MSELESCSDCLDPESMTGLIGLFDAYGAAIDTARATNDERWDSAIAQANELGADIASGELLPMHRQAIEKHAANLRDDTAKEMLAFGEYAETFSSVVEGMVELDCSSLSCTTMDICPKINYLISRIPEINQADTLVRELGAL